MSKRDVTAPEILYEVGFSVVVVADDEQEAAEAARLLLRTIRADELVEAAEVTGIKGVARNV